MDAQNYKILSPKKIDFCKILKIHEYIFESANFLLLFYIVQRVDATI